MVSIGKSLTTSFPAYYISALYPITLSVNFLTNSALAASSKEAPSTLRPETSTLRTKSFSAKMLALYFRSLFSLVPISYWTLNKEIGPENVKSAPSYCPFPVYWSFDDSAPISVGSDKLTWKSKSLTSPSCGIMLASKLVNLVGPSSSAGVSSSAFFNATG